MNVRKLSLTAILVFGMGTAAWSRPAPVAAAHDENAVIISGEVVQLEPGKLIVIRTGGKEMRYVLTPNVVLPPDVQIGKTASVQIEPGPEGASIVKRVTTTTVGPDGQVRETTETTRTDAMGDTTRTTTTTTLTGTIDAYMPGKSITIIDQKGKRVTYVLSPDAQLPTEVIMHKKALIYVGPKPQADVVYEIVRDGDTIKIKAKSH